MAKVILDLCGGTGSWSAPYKRSGEYEVHVITLPKYDIFDCNVHEDRLDFVSNNGETLSVSIEDVHGVLAAPTCTMFSLARTTAKNPRDFEAGMRLVKKCLEIIWACRQSPVSRLKFWAIENPCGFLRQFLGKPSLTFNPNDFGDCYTKKTDLWGFFKEPKKRHRELTEDEKIACRINARKLPKLPEGYVLPGGWNATAAKRSMTSSYFAEAFFKANR